MCSSQAARLERNRYEYFDANSLRQQDSLVQQSKQDTLSYSTCGDEHVGKSGEGGSRCWMTAVAETPVLATGARY